MLRALRGTPRNAKFRCTSGCWTSAASWPAAWSATPGRTGSMWTYLWVDDRHRGAGLGSRLLAEAERIARDERGCSRSRLETWDFQAPELLPEAGVRGGVRDPDYPPGVTEYTSWYKRLEARRFAEPASPPRSAQKRRAPAEGTAANTRGPCSRPAVKASATALVTVSASASSTRTIAEPPKPPPVIRAPSAPGRVRRVDDQVQLRAGDAQVVAERGVALGQDRADRRAYVARVEQGDDLLDPVVLGDDVADVARDDRPRRAEPRQRRVQSVVRHVPQGVDAQQRARPPRSRRGARAYAPSPSACLTRVSTTSSRSPSAARSKGTWRWERSRVSRCRAWPSVQQAEAIWSMMPQGTPTKAFSARWPDGPAAGAQAQFVQVVQGEGRDDLQGRRGGQARAGRDGGGEVDVRAGHRVAGLAQRPDDARRVGGPAAVRAAGPGRRRAVRRPPPSTSAECRRSTPSARRETAATAVCGRASGITKPSLKSVCSPMRLTRPGAAQTPSRRGPVQLGEAVPDLLCTHYCSLVRACDRAGRTPTRPRRSPRGPRGTGSSRAARGRWRRRRPGRPGRRRGAGPRPRGSGGR